MKRPEQTPKIRKKENKNKNGRWSPMPASAAEVPIKQPAIILVLDAFGDTKPETNKIKVSPPYWNDEINPLCVSVNL